MAIIFAMAIQRRKKKKPIKSVFYCIDMHAHHKIDFPYHYLFKEFCSVSSTQTVKILISIEKKSRHNEKTFPFWHVIESS